MNISVTIRNAASSLVWTDARIDATQRTSSRNGVRRCTSAASSSRPASGSSGYSTTGRLSSEDCTLWDRSFVLVHRRPPPYIQTDRFRAFPVRTPPRILIVDDNPTNVKVLQTRLVADGYEVVTAGDGEEGLVVARRDTPDLILLDVMMPRLDGLSLIHISEPTRQAE